MRNPLAAWEGIVVPRNRPGGMRSPKLGRPGECPCPSSQMRRRVASERGFGNNIGRGHGRAASTAFGIVIGAMVGNHVVAGTPR